MQTRLMQHRFDPGSSVSHRRRSGEAGQAMVEFSLTLLLTLTLFFGLIEFSRAVYTASVIHGAAQQGARVGIAQDPSDAGAAETIRTAVRDRLVGLDADLAVIDVPPWTNVVEVNVSYPFDFVVPIVAQITGDSITLSAEASMVAHY